jgi:hypothetical protein
MLADERWTSAVAPGRDPIDAEAAAILLQGVLDILSPRGQVHSN